jgi:hypothetical protein
MWVFYLISLPLTLGMVVVTLRYFAGPAVPRYVVITVGYAWFCSLSIIILVPADIWQVRSLAASLPHFVIHRPRFRPSSAPGSAGLAVGAVRSTGWSSFCVLVALQFLSVCTN